jgi:UTP:GlnB (protein PII) uridylyltransferase
MYNLRIQCKKGSGVLVQLTQALESLDFEIMNASLTAVNDQMLNTFVVKVAKP